MASTVGPLIVIVGETASGKSALAMKLAEMIDGEIIAADSRTVYEGMDIGTAKPTQEERSRIRHHLIDVVTPGQPFSVSQFKDLANKAIDDILRRGKIPILVGGTGLYVDSVIFDYKFNEPADPDLRSELSELSLDELHQRLKDNTVPIPRNSKNPRHLIRAIETKGRKAHKSELRKNTLMIGLKIDREKLRTNIENRVNLMIDQGLLNEVKSMAQLYGWEVEALQTPGYKALRKYFEGDITLEQAKQEFIKNDLSLAKRQRTWFGRNKSIQWVDNQRQAVDLTTTFLNKISASL